MGKSLLTPVQINWIFTKTVQTLLKTDRFFLCALLYCLWLCQAQPKNSCNRIFSKIFLKVRYATYRKTILATYFNLARRSSVPSSFHEILSLISCILFQVLLGSVLFFSLRIWYTFIIFVSFFNFFFSFFLSNDPWKTFFFLFDHYNIFL